ncbi:cation:proton antiporter [Sulfurimonas microaerophilic]|uniref:cation:proton antiporter domain-containing protein n=1 Tax=Sulfurimonas microaerophilic TaxID=3058392 RepID=UPI0027153277|nr:cation:proton antiporter [Sulfurimonas sp. hsl 1-7]
MLLLITILLLIILLSRLTEEMTKIPATLATIFYAFVLSLYFPQLFSVSKQEFNEVLYLMLPVILLPDILNISVKELKKYAKEIFYLAVVSVIFSIAIAVFVTPYLLPEYGFTIGMLVALYAMLMATDAITVSAIMSRFTLPKRLKIYAESESLFNDVTALILYYFIALPLLQGNSVDVLSINYTVLKVLVLSSFIGGASALFGFLALKMLRNPFDQFLVIYLIVISSFLLAEHFHIAGILSIVVSVIVFKILVERENRLHPKTFEITSKVKTYDAFIDLLKHIPAITKHEFREYKKEAMFLGIFANAVVFIVIANIINLSLLSHYIYEILIVFFITTVIRFGSLSALVVSSKLPFYWTYALTLSGMKGALAIIMVHSLPEKFVYYDLFTAIVVGNVLISTFLYTFTLMFHIKRFAKLYEGDSSTNGTKDQQLSELSKDIVEVLEKDPVSQAYNRIFIEDVLSREIARVQRYKVELSVIGLKFDFATISEEQQRYFLQKAGEIIQKGIRQNDYFGKVEEGHFIVLASNTSLGGAHLLAQKIAEQFVKALDGDIKYHFGVTELSETDSVETLFEKLKDAINKSIQNKQTIEIEV